MATMSSSAPHAGALRYTTGAIILHWAIALLIVLQLISGYAMAEVLRTGTKLQYDLYQLHKSFGVVVLMLTIARIVWRLNNPPPPEPASVSKLEGLASHAVHMAFYGLLLAVPLAGWVMITVSPIQVETILFFAPWLPWPHLPGLEDLSEPVRAFLNDASHVSHKWLAYAMAGLLVLHVAGAVKHHLTDGEFINRMKVTGGATVVRRAAGYAPTVLLTVMVFGGIVGAATYARQMAAPPTVASAPSPSAPSASASAPAASATQTAPAATTAADAAPPATPAAETDTATTASHAAAPPVAPSNASASGGAPAQNAWVVDPAQSTLSYAATYSGATVVGGFNSFNAAIVFDPDDLTTASIDVTIDTTSAFIDSSEISRANLAGNDGFDNADYGTARFQSQNVRAEGDGYVADGTLEIRGQSVPQSLAFDVTINGDSANAQGTLTLDRFDYGIGVSSDGSGDWLGPDVTVNVTLTAARGGTADTGEGASQEQAASVGGDAPVWDIVAPESTLTYAFTYEGNTVGGSLDRFTTDVQFDPNNLAGSSIRAVIDTTSVTFDGRGLSLRDVAGSDGLSNANFPEAVFQSTSISADGDGFVAEGTMSIRGVSKDIRLPFTLTPEEEGRIIAEGTAELLRSAFGFAAEAGLDDDTMSPRVTVTIRLIAIPPEALATQR